MKNAGRERERWERGEGKIMTGNSEINEERKDEERKIESLKENRMRERYFWKKWNKGKGQNTKERKIEREREREREVLDFSGSILGRGGSQKFSQTLGTF